MTLKTQLTVDGVALSETDRRRLERRLRALERRLVHHPDPAAALVLRPYPGGREVEADLRVQLGPLGRHLVSRRAAETAAHAVRLAAEDVERQLERQHAAQRGEPTFGVPSRRLPARLRPHPPGTGAGAATT
jgi:hypothetical protein